MKKRDIELEFAKICGEFKVIKRIVYIIFAIVAGLLLRVIGISVTQDFIITGNVIKNIPGQDNLTIILTIILIVSGIIGLIIIKRKEKK